MLGRFNHVFQDVQPWKSGTVPVAVTTWCKNDGHEGGTEYWSAAIVVTGHTCGLLHQHPSCFSHPARLCSQHPSRTEFELTRVKTATSKHMVKVLLCAPAPPHALSAWFLVITQNCMWNESRRCGFTNALWSTYTRQCDHSSVNAVMHNGSWNA
jgi:hypothetical protein